MQVVLEDKWDYKVIPPKVPSREEQADHFAVYVRTFWDKSDPFVLASRDFMELHFAKERLNNPLTEFGRKQYVKVGTLGKSKEWVEYQAFAHFQAGNNF